MQKGYFKKSLIAGLITGAALAGLSLGYVYYESKKNLTQSAKISKDINFKSLGISIKDLNGNKIDWSEFNGRNVLVNFWGTWCAPCVHEMPGLQKVYNDIDDRYVFLMISDEGADKIKAFKEKYGYSFTFVKTDEDLKSKIGVFPTTFALDKDQNIIFTKAGSFDSTETGALKELLIGKINK